ncbi:MAG: hypothetical protein V4692_04380 [Bdellovibrionota bacterium]
MSFVLRLFGLLLLPNLALAAPYARPELEILEQTLAPYREHFAATLKANPKLEESFAAYSKKAIAVLSDDKMTAKERSSVIRAMNEAQRLDLSKLMAASKISRKEFLRRTGEAVAKAQKKTGRKFSWKVGEALEVFVQAEPQPLPPEPLSPVVTTLAAPFEGNDFFEVGSERNVDLEAGFYFNLTKSVIAGGDREESGIAHFFSSPTGFNRIQFKPSVGNAKVGFSVIAGAGFTMASAHSDVIIARNGNNVCGKQFDHGALIAVVAWVAEDDHSDNFELPCMIRTPEGRDYVGTISSTTQTIAGAFAGSVAAIEVTVRDLKIKSVNQ